MELQGWRGSGGRSHPTCQPTTGCSRDKRYVLACSTVETPACPSSHLPTLTTPEFLKTSLQSH